MKLEHNRTAVLIGLGFSACLTLIILRGLFFSNGFLAYADATFSHDMSWNRDLFTHSWTQFMGCDNSHRIMHLPFMFPLTHLFSNTGTFTKALYFVIFTLIGTTSFSVAFAWLRERGTKLSSSYVGASVCALVYTLSTYTTMAISHYGGLFSYALLPLTFWFTRAAFRERSYSPAVVLKYGTILGLILMLATTMYYVFTLHMVVLVITALGQIVPRLIQERREVKRYLLYSSCLTGLTAAVFALLWAWYILPFLISYREGMTDVRHVIVGPDYVRAVAQNGNLFNVVRMLGFSDPDFGIYATTGAFRTAWLCATLAIPLLAITGAILRPRSRDTIVLVGLALIGVFLAKGPNGPFGNQYLWLFSHFDLLFLTGGLYFPIRAIPLVILPYAFLSAFAVTRILDTVQIRSYALLSASRLARTAGMIGIGKGPWRRNLSVATLAVVYILVCILICISSFPLLSGDRRGTMNPMVVPQPYNDANDWLSEDEGDYRVAWLPPSSSLEWNPHADSVDAWYSMNVAYIPPLLSSQPITSVEGIGLTSTPVERERLEQYIYYLLNSRKDSSLGTLLAMENAKYVLYHDDTTDKESFRDLFATLNQTEALTQVYSSDYVYLFVNEDYQPYLHTEGKSTLVVGGLDALGTGLVSEGRSFIFLEQNANTPDEIDTMLKCTDSILFYANEDIDDLVLGSLDSSYYHPALDCWDGDYRSPWRRDFFYSLYWYHQRILPSGLASTWDFDLNLGIMHTDKADAALTFKVHTAQDSYDIWVRSLLSDTGNSLEASVDGETIGQINSYSKDLQGFEWQRIGQRDFDKGQHEIVLKTAADGFNAVNAIAVVPTKTLAQHQNEILDRIQRSDIRLIYLTDYSKMTRSVDDINLVNITKSAQFTTIDNREYAIAVRVTPETDNATLTISVDGIKTDLPVDKGGWLHSTFSGTGLSKHEIAVGGQGVTIGDVAVFPSVGDAQGPADILDSGPGGTVLDYKIVSPTKIVVTVEASEPCILSFGESYHGSWVATDGPRTLPKIALNSVANGFLVERTGTYEIVLEFALEKYLTAGEVISGLTLMILLGTLALIYRYERRSLGAKKAK
jgi:hypothetical protein